MPDPIARDTATAAVRALLHEVSATPKPGLVDRANSGAHTDMDFATFVDSAAALWPYYYEVTRLGAVPAVPPGQLLPLLRPAGIEAEAAMLAATGGVNTHKGLIFSLGVLCAARGYLCATGAPCTAQAMLDTAALVCGGLCDEFEEKAPQALTKGRRAYAQHRVAGIRGEMAAGLPAVRHHGYPVLRRLLRAGHSLNDAGVITLLHLITVVEDTNIIGRAGLDALRALQADVRLHLAQMSQESLVRYAFTLDSDLISKNISPGGSADLLAICYFLYFIMDDTLPDVGAE